MDRLYCTLAHIIADLNLVGSTVNLPEEELVEISREASDIIDRRFGAFIPFTETRRFDGPGGVDLWLNYPLLSDEDGATVTDDGDSVAAADLNFYPRAKHWENGPYTRLSIDPDASAITHWTRERDVITIAGQWGKYNSTKDTGETITLDDGTGTDLTVANGTSISPGQVCLIESEQILVEATGDPTDSTTDTNGAIDKDDQTLTVDDGSVFNTGEIIRVGLEKMRILGIATHDLYIERGWDGTRRATHIDGSNVFVYRTYTIKRGINGTTAAAHSSKSLYKYLIPGAVQFLARQICGLMIKKIQSSYAGRVANVDLGEVFYIEEIPERYLKKVEKLYMINVLGGRL